ncbi:hypothetical protein BCR35DRAFT_353463 [Leucosporidium creatinivorum]|uniref:Cyclin-domain-containing protein n=1 Tax=Leucosporidium creatinivorum TaxID=106004 RepID=A0A1Y2EWJ9_9BASI|nr:hypothetical protein BCR35DRAFT_353463 [Leucosporidium creatinivorum]
MAPQQQQVSPSDSEHSFDWHRSSFSSSRSSFSTQASALSPPPPPVVKMDSAGFLATPTTPSAFPQPPRNVPLQPIAPGAVPPSPPQLQPISTLAAFAGELFVWLWFAPPSSALQGSTAAVKASKQQLQPSERFLRFTHDLLSTTQVSHSVVILALLFISRLKSKNDINGSPGSEFRSSVTALMMANKVLDDNTYTAKTWADVSALELKPLVAGEAEFLRGLDWNLHVTERDFASWLKLLEGLVAARNSQVGKSSRKVGTKQGRTVAAGNGGTELLGLGLGVGLSFGGSVTPSGRSTKRPREEDGAQEDRRRSSAGNTLPGGCNTTNNTPQTRFATFSFPSTFSSAPHAAPSSAPLHAAPFQFGSSTSTPLAVSPLSSRHVATTSRRRPSHARHGHSHSIPPPITTSEALRPKRRADEAFGDAQAPAAASALEAPAPKRLQAAWLSRSFSAGASPAPQRSIYIHPGHSFPSHPQPLPRAPQPYQPSPTNERFTLPPLSAGFAPEMGRQLSSGRRREGGARETLADAFSPRYDPRQGMRAENLGFYSLGAKHQYQHQQPSFGLPLPTPRPSSSSGTGYIPVHPSHLSNTTSPALSPLAQYHNSAGAPFQSQAHSPTDTFSFTPKMAAYPPQQQQQQPFRRSSAPQSLPLPLQRAPVQYSQYSNAGLPGVYWQAGAEPGWHPSFGRAHTQASSP